MKTLPLLERMVMKAMLLSIRPKAPSQCNSWIGKGARSQRTRGAGRLDQKQVKRRPARVTRYLDVHSLGDNSLLGHSQRVNKSAKSEIVLIRSS